MISKKLLSQQASILDELSSVEPKGEFKFWTLSDTENFSEANLAKATILNSGQDICEILWVKIEELVKQWSNTGNINIPPTTPKPIIGTDIESTGLEYYLKEVIGWGFVLPKSINHWINLEQLIQNDIESIKQIDCNVFFDFYFVHSYGDQQKEVFHALSELINYFNDDIKWVLHNAKFDQHWFKSRLGVYLTDIEDSMCMAYLLGEKALAIDILAPKYLSRFPTTLSKLTGLEKSALRNAKPEVFLGIPIDQLADYCAEDCIEGILLCLLFTEMLSREYTTYGQDEFVPHTLLDLYNECDRLSINALCWAEETGVLINWDSLSEVRNEIDIELEAIQLETGIKANLTTEEAIEICASPKKLSNLLFNVLGLPTDGNKKGKAGFFSTAEDKLQVIRKLHPVPDLILLYREYAKLKSTYVEGLWSRQRNKKIHTTFNNCRAVTGRYTCDDPNLQQIPNPAKSEVGKAIRQLFIASPGNVLVKADYSQFELRILAHLSQDPYLIDSYRKGLDIHSAVTCLLFKIPIQEFKPDSDKDHKKKRTVIKTVNFGLIYGMEAMKLYAMTKAAGMDYTLKDCQDIMQSYWANLPGVAEWMIKTKLKAIREGYTETVLGRRRYFDFEHPYLKALRGKPIELTLENWKTLEAKGVLSEWKDQEKFRQCGNAPIQGSNADAIRICMGKCYEEWFKSPVKLLLTVHDEIVLECPEDMSQSVSARLKEIMESAIKLEVPVVVEPSIGLNWGDC